MSLGKNLKSLREEHKLTQEQVADRIGVTFQAVSSWERDEYKPETDKLIKLAELFEVSVSALVEDRQNCFKTKDTIYNWEHMKTYIKTTAKALKLDNTLKALEFAVEAHKSQKRKKSDVPYIYHSLNMACYLLSMNITEDEIIAACLLHDVIEDCGKAPDDLPVNDDVRDLVSLLTHSKTTEDNRDAVMKKYYGMIAKNPKASLIKCVDRCNNITTMSWGLSREKIYRMIKETEQYYPVLLRVIKAEPEYNNAAWLLQYQMESMLDIYKRLL